MKMKLVLSMVRRNLFARFRSDNFDVKDEPIFFLKIEQGKLINTLDIDVNLGINHKTISNHIHKTGYEKKLNVWVSHKLK